MTMTEKAVAAAFKNIGITLYIIGVGSASGPPKEYSITKANYFYDKAREDIKEWLVEIDRIIEVNNVAGGRRVAVAAAHLRDTTAEWYEMDKVNIT